MEIISSIKKSDNLVDRHRKMSVHEWVITSSVLGKYIIQLNLPRCSI